MSSVSSSSDSLDPRLCFFFSPDHSSNSGHSEVREESDCLSEDILDRLEVLGFDAPCDERRPLSSALTPRRKWSHKRTVNADRSRRVDQSKSGGAKKAAQRRRRDQDAKVELRDPFAGSSHSPIHRRELVDAAAVAKKALVNGIREIGNRHAVLLASQPKLGRLVWEARGEWDRLHSIIDARKGLIRILNRELPYPTRQMNAKVLEDCSLQLWKMVSGWKTVFSTAPHSLENYDISAIRELGPYLKAYESLRSDVAEWRSLGQGYVDEDLMHRREVRAIWRESMVARQYPTEIASRYGGALGYLTKEAPVILNSYPKVLAAVDRKVNTLGPRMLAKFDRYLNELETGLVHSETVGGVDSDDGRLDDDLDYALTLAEEYGGHGSVNALSGGRKGGDRKRRVGTYFREHRDRGPRLSSRNQAAGGSWGSDSGSSSN